MTSPLHQLHDAGQSIWLDYIDRSILKNGDLARRIKDDALTGMTSNPSIFEKALAEGTAYDDQIRGAPRSPTAMQLFELVETTDVRDACDIFRGVHEQSKGADGFVSIEVSPGAANDMRATVAEAERLWATVKRPNVMIKIPGTAEGAKAVERTIAAGINVNITLLFAIEAYASVIEAYMQGLEERVKAGKDLSAIHSVASFFVSRVDSEVDKRLGANDALKGKAATANAKLAYDLFKKQTATPRWKALAAKGASVQRPLWASTSTKNPAYRDTMYVVDLVAPGVVNTMPEKTLDATADHGEVTGDTITGHYADAQKLLDDLAALGISYNDVVQLLEVEGVDKFEQAWGGLLETVTANLEKAAK